MTRAQRAAVGPGGGKPLVTNTELTPGQKARVAYMRKAFGNGVKTIHTSGPENGHLYITMQNAVRTAIWEFDLDGEYVQRYSQGTLSDDIFHPDAT